MRVLFFAIALVAIIFAVAAVLTATPGRAGLARPALIESPHLSPSTARWNEIGPLRIGAKA